MDTVALARDKDDWVLVITFFVLTHKAAYTRKGNASLLLLLLLGCC